MSEFINSALLISPHTFVFSYPGERPGSEAKRQSDMELHNAGVDVFQSYYQAPRLVQINTCRLMAYL
jgi:hypothetical protein